MIEWQEILSAKITGVRPLLWLDDERLLIARGYQIWIFYVRLREQVFVADIPVSGRLRVGVKSRIFSRVFRAGVHAAQILTSRYVLVVSRGTIWRVDLETGGVVVDFVIPNNRRLLFLSRLSGEVEGLSSIVFGEYFDNPKRLPVGVWRRRAQVAAVWEQVYIFPQGAVNHVHNICSSQDGGLWILTGDFEHSAALWRSTSDFTRITAEFYGHQHFRACWLREFEDGRLIWATDTQLEENNLYQAIRSDGQWVAQLIGPIEGSSIYWQQTHDGVVFSSTVEPGEPRGRFFSDLFCRERGPGIRSDTAVLYLYDGKGEIRELSRATKDCWPHRLAQFGCFVLPAGVGPSGLIICSGQALSEIDGRVLLFQHPPSIS